MICLAACLKHGDKPTAEDTFGLIIHYALSMQQWDEGHIQFVEMKLGACGIWLAQTTTVTRSYLRSLPLYWQMGMHGQRRASHIQGQQL